MAINKNYDGGRKVFARKVAEDYHDTYDSAEFNLSTGQTDYDVAANVTGAFSNIKNAHSIIIRTNKTITIKLNDDANASITITAAEGSLTIDRKMGFEITNVLITNASGVTAAIKILLFE